MKTYVFRVELEQDEDGRWGAEVPSLPGCATWGHTKDQALEALSEATQAYLDVLSEKGWPLPEEAEEEIRIISSSDVVTATL
ncbi:MAG: type II toxin-antitoxin system HicB family antitoxin [SAR202 cluster bacterium]|jgi:predicted RNase H-like HicB family nuclease|nr:type II toxin-antitoxin system HicB family antitoxin [SAR202 cluster bacterium]MDP6716273.1 type II toxin-antitoxin system HicB family antitoxin [SAR202 cluster bacterium]